MRLPLIPMPVVWHVGLLDPSLRGHQHAVSYEGAGLSVSNCPEAWKSMAFLNGPTLRLDRPGALWIDLVSLPDAARAAAIAHAVEGGLAEERRVWRSWIWEAGRDAWHSRPFDTDSEARAFTVEQSDTEEWPRPTTLAGHLAALPPEAFPLPCADLGEEVLMPLLTKAGNERGMGFGRRVDATDILIAFWAEDVLREACPDIVGTWWRERFDVRSDLAPRGAIFPSAIGEFDATRVKSPPILETEPSSILGEVSWSGMEAVAPAP